MKIFSPQEVKEVRFPTREGFSNAAEEITLALQVHKDQIPYAMWWGSFVRDEMRITSDLDLVVLVQDGIVSLETIQVIGHLHTIASQYAVPLEVMCVPLSNYRMVPGSFSASRFCGFLEASAYVRSRVLGGPEYLEAKRFGVPEIGSKEFQELCYREAIGYALHKYDVCLRQFPVWERLPHEERHRIAGKLLGVPKHAIMKIAHAYRVLVRDVYLSSSMKESRARLVDMVIRYEQFLRCVQDGSCSEDGYSVYLDELLAQGVITVKYFLEEFLVAFGKKKFVSV